MQNPVGIEPLQEASFDHARITTSEHGNERRPVEESRIATGILPLAWVVALGLRVFGSLGVEYFSSDDDDDSCFQQLEATDRKADG